MSACPGDEVVINCYESDTTAAMAISLRWEITPMNNLFAMIDLALSDMGNNTERQDLGLKFYSPGHADKTVPVTCKHKL